MSKAIKKGLILGNAYLMFALGIFWVDLYVCKASLICSLVSFISLQPGNIFLELGWPVFINPLLTVWITNWLFYFIVGMMIGLAIQRLGTALSSSRVNF